MDIAEAYKQKRAEFNQKATEWGHTGKYVEEAGMIDLYECSCGWKSKPYFDGAEYAYSEWTKHVEQTRQPYIKKTVVTVQNVWNKDYNQNAKCVCGHPYYRHFDTYEDMYNAGCKYCDCTEFKLEEENDTSDT